MTATTLSAEDLDTLVTVSEETLRVALVERRQWRPEPRQYAAALRRPGAAFVTIRRDEQLLGCVGMMEPVESLVSVVAHRTLAAAFQDPRTRGVFPEDFAFVHIEVSVLSPLERFSVATYDELVAHVDLTREGVLVEAGRHRATFLPAVWDQLSDPEEFVAALWQKAGMPRRAWPASLELSRYAATKAYGVPPRRAIAA